MAMDVKIKGSYYTLNEEIGNSVSHGIGTILALVGTALMLVKSTGNALYMVSSAIYGASMILLFCMSSLYHCITNQRAKHILRICDHTSIFLLIAGTYTPYTLITLHGVIGWTIFSIVWATAVFGIILNLISIERFKKISMICYIASGWCVVLAIVPLFRLLAWQGIVLLVLGGVFYTVGILFYRLKNIRYMHMIWHFFVLAGAITQYFSILLYVL